MMGAASTNFNKHFCTNSEWTRLQLRQPAPCHPSSRFSSATAHPVRLGLPAWFRLVPKVGKSPGFCGNHVEPCGPMSYVETLRGPVHKAAGVVPGRFPVRHALRCSKAMANEEKVAIGRARPSGHPSAHRITTGCGTCVAHRAYKHKNHIITSGRIHLLELVSCLQGANAQ